jgi:hypothetical protein
MNHLQVQNSKLVYFYHPDHSDSRVVDFAQEGAGAKEAELLRAGWSRDRFAQMLYHPDLGTKICRRPQEVADLLAKGWRDKPIPAGDSVHADTIHPHDADDHRLASERVASKSAKSRRVAVTSDTSAA